MLLGAVLLLSMYLIFYAFARFSYEISGDAVTIRWQILGIVPFARRTIRICDIRQAKEFDLRKDFWRGAEILGNLFLKRGVIVQLNRRWMGLAWRLYITPADPDDFIAQINQKLRGEGVISAPAD